METQRLKSLEEVTAAIEASPLKKGPKRGGFYCPEGECYFVYLEDVLSYAERVDELFTVYKAIEGDRLIGFQVKCSNVPAPHQLEYSLGRLKHDPSAPIEAVKLVIHALQASSQLQGGRLPQARDLTQYFDAVSALGQQRVPVRRVREMACAK